MSTFNSSSDFGCWKTSRKVYGLHKLMNSPAGCIRVSGTMKRSRKRKQKQKQKRTSITDLNVDVLKLIMLFVAKSSDGAGSFARALSVCKGFMEIAEDKEVLKAIVFEERSVSEFDESFWKINGLLSKCSSASNMAAVNILLTYLGERVEYSMAKERIVELAVKHLSDMVEAVRAVFTRARLGAAMLAGKIVKLMLHDIRMDIDEIREHLEQFKVAAFVKGG